MIDITTTIAAPGAGADDMETGGFDPTRTVSEVGNPPNQWLGALLPMAGADLDAVDDLPAGESFVATTTLSTVGNPPNQWRNELVVGTGVGEPTPTAVTTTGLTQFWG